jgi:transposase
LAYKELWRVEPAFSELKTGLEIRPVRHWVPSKVRGYFGVCFLVLVMESTLARMLREKNPQVNYRKVLKGLKQVKAVRVELDDRAFLLRTELPGRAYDAFQSVGLRPPPRLQSLSTSS